MQDSIEVAVRETLSHYPVPRPTSAAIERVVLRSVRTDLQQRALPTWAQRGILACYWLTVLLAAFAIARSVPLPEWNPSALTTFTTWIVPVCGALLVWRDALVGALHDMRARYF